MTRTYTFTQEQLNQFKVIQGELKDAVLEANIRIEYAKIKQKALDDLITMVCSVLNFDKNKSQLNLDTGTLTQEKDDTTE